MQLVSLKTGKPEDVGDNFLEPLASGTHVPIGKKALLDPDGQLVFVKAEDVPRHLGEFGYKVPNQAQWNEFADQEKYGEGIGNEARAGLEGAARGATFGLSDAAQTALGVSSEGLRQRKERNPISSTVGE